jgi:hypothetical protein
VASPWGVHGVERRPSSLGCRPGTRRVALFCSPSGSVELRKNYIAPKLTQQILDCYRHSSVDLLHLFPLLSS